MALANIAPHNAHLPRSSMIFPLPYNRMLPIPPSIQPWLFQQLEAFLKECYGITESIDCTHTAIAGAEVNTYPAILNAIDPSGAHESERDRVSSIVYAVAHRGEGESRYAKSDLDDPAKICALLIGYRLKHGECDIAAFRRGHEDVDTEMDIGWIRSWCDHELLAFLQAHYDIPIESIDNLANNVAGLIGDFEDPENDEAFVARVIYAAINRNMLDLKALGLEKVGSYIWVAAVLVDWRERHHEAKIQDLQRKG